MMKHVLFLFAGLFTIQSVSSQVKNRDDENAVFRTADSILASDFSGVILIETPHAGKKVFSGGIANEETGKPIGEDQLFNLLSLGKSFTAAAIVKLAQEGELGLDDPIEKYLRDRNIPNQDKITIRQLLGHTSGLGDYMTADEYKTLHRSRVDLETLLSIVESQPVKGSPGETFVYSNSGYIVLGAILEAIEGEPYEEVLREKILEPAGIREVRFSTEDREVNYYVKGSDTPVNEDLPPASSDGGIWMSAKDLSRFLNFLYSDAFTDESRHLLFDRMTEFPDRGERKNAGLAASFLVYEYPAGVKVTGNNGGFKGSTYSAFRVMYNENGEKVMAIVLSNREGTAGPAMRTLESEIKEVLQ